MITGECEVLTTCSGKMTSLSDMIQICANVYSVLTQGIGKMVEEEIFGLDVWDCLYCNSVVYISYTKENSALSAPLFYMLLIFNQ